MGSAGFKIMPASRVETPCSSHGRQRSAARLSPCGGHPPGIRGRAVLGKIAACHREHRPLPVGRDAHLAHAEEVLHILDLKRMSQDRCGEAHKSQRAEQRSPESA